MLLNNAMGVSFGLVLCLAYIVGLLLSPIAGYLQFGSLAIPWSGIIGLGALVGWGFLAPRRWRLGWQVAQWCSLGVVILLAATYMTARAPVAGSQDISAYVERAAAIAADQVIVGRAIEDPRLNRDSKGRFLVAVKQLQVLDAEGTTTFQIPVQGRVYVTAPLLQVTGLHSGQRIKARGHLYRPQPAMNPNGFDFQTYLAQRGAFTGLVAEELRFNEATGWGLWQLRQRIVRTQVRALGSPLGQLVSAMALGHRAVDLPMAIQAVFGRVGLAHTIAASGFHVSLLLGIVLAAGRSRSGKTLFIIGSGVLISYVALTGAPTSVVRAALMGVATLMGLAMERKVIPTGALLVAATLMLLFNPHWLWHVSFQLSVMATWGLIVTVPVLMRYFDGLPVMVASLIAVPMAATLWTLPLTLYHFNVLAGLGVALNVVAMPLVTIVSLGGIVSSALAIVLPWVGSMMASLLYYPATMLLWLAQASSHLPGSAIAIGQISLWQLVGLYGVLLSLWGGPWLVRNHHHVLRPLLAIAFLAIILCPIGWRWLTQEQITVLAAGSELIWVQQDHGHTTLINSGDAKTAFYTVEPFLTQAGVNQIESAIALPFSPDYQSGWQDLLAHISTKHLYSSDATAAELASNSQFHLLEAGTSTPLRKLTVQLLGAENPIVRLSGQPSWLLLPDLPLATQDHLAKAGAALQSQVLVWSGSELSAALLEVVNPETIICYGSDLPASTERDLQQRGVSVFWTRRDGAITWQPQQGFQSYLTAKHHTSYF